MAFHVYVLANAAGAIYIGQTADLERRVAQHNDPEFRGTLHTKRHPGPWTLLWSEQYQTRSSAMKRERELKTGKGREWIRRQLAGGC
jgi:putative endonuclease